MFLKYILRAQNLGGRKKLGRGQCHRISPRGYGPNG